MSTISSMRQCNALYGHTCLRGGDPSNPRLMYHFAYLDASGFQFAAPTFDLGFYFNGTTFPFCACVLRDVIFGWDLKVFSWLGMD